MGFAISTQSCVTSETVNSTKTGGTQLIQDSTTDGGTESFINTYTDTCS